MKPSVLAPDFFVPQVPRPGFGTSSAAMKHPERVEDYLEHTIILTLSLA